MGKAKLRKYEVLSQCYVPVGPGLKYKVAGQVVTLDDDDAAELSEFLAPVEEPKSKGVQKLNSRAKAKAEPEPEEVKADGSEPAPADERAGSEVLE